MNKFFKGAMFVAVSGVLMLTCGCKPKPNGGEKKFDSETRVLQLSTSMLDGNFNPFFYTSGNDGSILSMTQLGFLTTDNEGKIICGEDHPTVALDYSTTMYDSKTVGTGNVTTTGSMDGRTEYEFLIKKDIKFSDGTTLTIKDVLFNMYVYLDPAYTGSATMYSTDIQGLTAYRLQDPAADDNTDANMKEKEFLEKAENRVNAVINWAENSPTMETVPPEDTEGVTLKADWQTTKDLYRKELTSDWTAISSSWKDSYEDSYSFTAAWQAYLLNVGLVTEQTKINLNGVQEKLYNDLNGNGKKDDGEPYYTTLDAPVGNPDKEPEAQLYISGIAEATTDAKVQKYMSDNNCDRDYAVLQLQSEYCINTVHDTMTGKEKIPEILTYWATATSVREELAGKERTKYYEEIKLDGNLAVQSISGITTRQTNVFNGKTLDGTYDVLKIVINGVDPKAIFNFGFSVAPMHYYAGGTFSKDNKDYAAEALKGNGFGVCLGDGDFFKEILQDTSKNRLPVGAGAYKASTSDGGKTKPTPSTFYQAGVVYFERNTNFHTVGKGIENAKIKYVNYKELRDDQMMDALETQSIDFGMPNATNSNVNKVSQNGFLSSTDYRTNGYGYIGVNPKFIPEYKIRQAIMKAMDTNKTVEYYSGKLAEVIYRPMSMMSWAYPDGVTEYNAIKFDLTSDRSEIKQLVKDAGYELQKGVYTKTKQIDGMANATNGTKLKFTFTLAGESTDHPAYSMFMDAAAKLNAIGFDITVTNNASALRDMTSGNLAVWAAAWSSATDPDPYQVYHKDSKATSVNNWNYPNILKDSTGKWGYEQGIIKQLSEKIDAGRQTLSQDTREAIYAECLDLIMDLSVELPTYQRSDLCVYNNTVIDAKTLVKNPNCFIGLFDKLWEIDYV